MRRQQVTPLQCNSGISRTDLTATLSHEPHALRGPPMAQDSQQQDQIPCAPPSFQICTSTVLRLSLLRSEPNRNRGPQEPNAPYASRWNEADERARTCRGPRCAIALASQDRRISNPVRASVSLTAAKLERILVSAGRRMQDAVRQQAGRQDPPGGSLYQV